MRAGFRIVELKMGDFETGKQIWSESECTKFGNSEGSQVIARIPKAILGSSAVSREIVFSSQQQIRNFNIKQRVFLHEELVEYFEFKFGFVIPGSTNSWQQVISADTSNMMDPDVLSGHLVVETLFLD